MFTVTVAGDAKSGDPFLYDLKSAYRSCTKEGNASIPISVLADKYVEMHSKEEYKKNLKGTRLKTFLSNSGHFNCTGDKVTMIIGNVSKYNLREFTLLFLNTVVSSKQGESSLFSSDKEPSSSVATTTASIKVVVHFEYGDQKFAKRISIDIQGVLSKFHEEVMSVLQKRKPGYRPADLKILCGSYWYDFTGDTEFDDLCLKDDNPELFINAEPTPIETGNFI